MVRSIPQTASTWQVGIFRFFGNVAKRRFHSPSPIPRSLFVFYVFFVAKHVALVSLYRLEHVGLDGLFDPFNGDLLDLLVFFVPLVA